MGQHDYCEAGAASEVMKITGSGNGAPAETSAPNEICGALRAALVALPTPEAREKLHAEFIKLAGADDCGSLKGGRCGFWIELAANLVKQYRYRTVAGKRRVMLLGDSIRCNYQEAVKAELGDNYDVVTPNENGRFAKYTLNELERWFAMLGDVDVIHWNNGLWDSAIVCREDGMFTPPDEYVETMGKILRELRKHAKTVIFATTTPVRGVTLNHKIEYIDALNAAIVPYMKEHDVVIDDLYALVKSRQDELLRGTDGIHLNLVGMAVCGKAVADSIRAAFDALND